MLLIHSRLYYVPLICKFDTRADVMYVMLFTKTDNLIKFKNSKKFQQKSS